MVKTRSNQIAWHIEILPRITKRAFLFLAGQSWLERSGWYLAGGTALALIETHRQSVDLDFFSPQKTFQIQRLLGHLPQKYWQTDIAREATIYGRLFGAKVSFIAYPFFKPTKIWHYESVPILSPQDIAVMKIIAISQRGRKRDFIDLYWYIKTHESLVDIIQRLPQQYPTITHDFHHILKSLIYFADAEKDPMPKLFFQVTWKQVKRFFEKEVPVATRKLLRF